MFGFSLVSLLATLLILLCGASALIIITRSFVAGPSSDAMDTAFREHLLQKHKLSKELHVELSVENHRTPVAPIIRTEKSTLRHRGIDTIWQKSKLIQEKENLKAVIDGSES